jgi:hypothetical protein
MRSRPMRLLPLWLGRDGDTLYWKNGADYATATVVDSQAGMFGVGLQLDTALNDIDGCFLLTFERSRRLQRHAERAGDGGRRFEFVGHIRFPMPLSEGVTAAFSLASAVTFPNALSESLTAADSLVAGLVMSAVLSESLTAAFTPTVAAVFASSLAEGITAAFVPTVAATFASALSEGLTAAAAQTVAAIFANALTESVTAADSDGAVATFSNALAESAVAGAVLVDQLISGTTYNEVLSENIVASVSYAFVDAPSPLSGIAADETAEFLTSRPINLEAVAVDNKIAKAQFRATSGAIPFATGPGIDRGGLNWLDDSTASWEPAWSRSPPMGR